MENKLPTAEEFLKSDNGFDDNDIKLLAKSLKTENRMDISDICQTMIEFAKLHVEAQTEAILKITHKNGIPRIVDNKESIIDAYPLTNIK